MIKTSSYNRIISEIFVTLGIETGVLKNIIRFFMGNEIKYPIGIQTFSEIRESGFVYVDKTEYIHSLVSRGKYYFLSRPRRFGKSLLLSTIHEYFNGRRDLFEGLAISKYDHDWKSYPVLHIDFTGADYTDFDGLNAILNSVFNQLEKNYEITTSSTHPGVRFGEIIQGVYEKTGNRVVILVDEYDKPLLDSVNNPDLQEKFRNILRSVYGNLKKMDGVIKFAMLTGITKFGRLSIFSDINNLKDISLLPQFAGICGVSVDELKKYFCAGVEALATRNNFSVEKAYEVLKTNYDGYHFSPENMIDIYNPYSLISALDSEVIREYWFDTGTPNYLVKMIRSSQLPLLEMYDIYATLSEISSVSFTLGDSLIPLLYQSGYLTIKDFSPLTQYVTLGYPNGEVERGFLNQLMKIYVPSTKHTTEFSINKFYKDVEEGRAEDFMQRLQSLYADFNNDGMNKVELEQHYQDIAFLIFKLLGFITHVEYKTAAGRIDLVVKTNRYIYVFEFKRNKTAEEALRQIDEKGYLIPFKADGRKLIKIGVNFSDSIKGIESYIIT